ncbi:hypothetical protein [Flaviaesturariibacter amylovorans]|uniref:Uncharacterized protein n=1 Tax=Flaviaesturariibacter amylovorans TaxID=1084520 RepID=A0ABP8GT63_9BACT
MRYVLVILFCFSGLLASACDCIGAGGLDKADVAFKGTVLRVRRIENGGGSYVVHFRVQEWFKGRQYTRTLFIETPCLSKVCCGIPFKRGEVYEVYAKNEPDRMVTSACWKTKRVGTATK